MMRPAKFALDFLEGQEFEGFTRGETWNGFACPLFTREQAERLAEAWRARGHEARYDAGADAFTFQMDSGGEEYDTFPAVEADGQRLYPVGASCWIWDEI
ncbi:MAG: hypothetical protein JOZ96_05510 [Acidobacteria bacterium]|nr:hypothetical protein [Acidobacteriota bacterium]